MDDNLRLLWLIPLGFLAGGYGTLIGAGGGFVLAPALLIIYPEAGPETIASISLAVVFFNALSGTLAYARSGKIQFKWGIIFAVATIPGAVAGALATTAVSRARFNLIFGLLLIAVAILLAVINPGKTTIAQAGDNADTVLKFKLTTVLVGSGLSTVFGFISSFLGIGGGFLYVPTLLYLLKFNVHTAAATSLFVLTITAFTGSATHIAAGFFEHGFRRAIALSIGAVAGAQIAARLSPHLQGDWIIRSLAFALALAGLRIAGW